MTKTLTAKDGVDLEIGSPKSQPGRVYVRATDDRDTVLAGPFSPADLYAAIEAETGEKAREGDEARGDVLAADLAHVVARLGKTQAQLEDAQAFAELWKEAARAACRSLRAARGARDYFRAESIRETRLALDAEARADQAEAERDEANAALKQMAKDFRVVRAQRDYAGKRAREAEAERDEAIKARDGWHDLYLTTRAERDEARTIAASRLGQRENTMTAREHLDAAWDAAHVPADGKIPAETAYLWRSKKDGRVAEARPDHEEALADSPVLERRLLDPPRPKWMDDAEEIEPLLREIEGVGFVTDPVLLSRHLAERGVRKVEDGEE